MAARYDVHIEVLLVVLCPIISWAKDSYELKNALTKETWPKIQQLGDISSDVETVLQQYTGHIAEDCFQQLPQQNYRAGLDKKLAFYFGKLEYDDKLLQRDLIKCGSSEPCKEECTTKYQNNMDACLTNANVIIPGLKEAAIKNLKDFMDSCTSGNKVTKDQGQQVIKGLGDQDQQEYSEAGDQYHW